MRGETIGDAEGKLLHRLARGGFFVDASGAQRGLPAFTAARGFARSTHLPTSLDALALADDDVRLFVVDRTVGGMTVVRRVEHSDALAKAEASGLTLSRLWVQGVFGGVPNVW